MRRQKDQRHKVTHSCGHTTKHELSLTDLAIKLASLRAAPCSSCRKTEELRKRLRLRDGRAIPALADFAAQRKRARLLPVMEREANLRVGEGDRRYQQAFRVAIVASSSDWWLSLPDDPTDVLNHVVDTLPNLVTE